MAYFRHSADDIILIDDGASQVVMPLAFFQTQEVAYALGGAYTRREYQVGSYHKLYDATSEYDQGIPYADGDTYITKVAAYNAAYTIYLALPPSLAAAKTQQISAMLGYAHTIRDGYVVYNTKTHFSGLADLAYLKAEFDTYTPLSALPGAYYVNDIAYAQIAFANLLGTPSLSELIDKIVAFHYLIRLNEDAHRIAIEALATIVAVLAYDYTTGWPTIPYP